jgi:tetratricopeptide (TPR) repeat protein
MKIHPHDLLLQEFFGTLGAEHRKMLKHLTECPACQSRARALLLPRPKNPLVERIAKVLRWPGGAPDYGPVIDHSAQFFRCRQSAYERERAEAAGLAAELLEHPAERRQLIVRNNPRFHTWGLFELLLEEGREQSFNDPAAGEELARLALELSDHLDASYYGSERIEDLRARAWACVGNARRVKSDLRQAEEAFATAAAHLQLGTRDPIERAIFLDLKASLLRAERRLAEAMRLLRQAFEIFLAAGDRHRAGRALVNMDFVHHHAGTPEEGIPLLYQALELIDPAQEPRLLLCTWHNLIDDLAEAGRCMEAHGLLGRARAVYRRFPDAWTQNRRRWVEGKIARGLGQHAQAEALLAAARDGFLAEDVPYNVALVSLDLALLYAVQQRTAELKRLAAEMLPVFTSRRIHREALAALSFWRQAVEAESAGVELVSGVAAYLRRSQFDQELTFQGWLGALLSVT